MAAMVAVIASMALVEDARPQLLPSFILLAAAWWHGRRAPRAERAPAAGRRRVAAT
jgi:hypothetical protein